MIRILIVCALALFPLSAHAQERWAVYYTDAVAAEKFQPFDLVVFDSNSHPQLLPLKVQGKTLLGYVSLGEAESYRPYFQELQEKSFFLKENARWKGHHIIDVRNPAWTQYVLDVLIPSVIDQGFDGIMIDTIDSVTQLEFDDPKQYAGMQTAAIDLLKSIRARYPLIKIMLNRGFDILPRVARDIDMVMAESTYTDVPADTKKPVLLKLGAHRAYVEKLQSAQQQNPALKIYSVDYWPAKDKKGVQRIYAAQRDNGFVPYVTDISLQRLSMEPQ